MNRAHEIVDQLVENDLAEKAKNIRVADTGFVKEKKEPRKEKKSEVDGQLSFFGSEAESRVAQKIRGLNLSEMTPIAALNILYELQKEIP